MKKFLLILFLGIVLVVLVGGYLVYTNKDKIAMAAMNKMFEMVQQEVVKSKPESMSEERITSAFEGAKASIMAGQVDEQKLQSVAQRLQMNMQDKVLDSTEVVQIVEDLEAIAMK